MKGCSRWKSCISSSRGWYCTLLNIIFLTFFTYWLVLSYQFLLFDIRTLRYRVCCLSTYLSIIGKISKILALYINNFSAKVSLWWIIILSIIFLKVFFLLEYITKKRNDYHSVKIYCIIVLSIRTVCKLTLLNIQSHQEPRDTVKRNFE